MVMYNWDEGVSKGYRTPRELKFFRQFSYQSNYRSRDMMRTRKAYKHHESYRLEYTITGKNNAYEGVCVKRKITFDMLLLMFIFNKSYSKDRLIKGASVLYRRRIANIVRIAKEHSPEDFKNLLKENGYSVLVPRGVLREGLDDNYMISSYHFLWNVYLFSRKKTMVNMPKHRPPKIIRLTPQGKELLALISTSEYKQFIQEIKEAELERLSVTKEAALGKEKH